MFFLASFVCVESFLPQGVIQVNAHFRDSRAVG